MKRTDEQIHEQLSRAYAHAAPDMLDAVLADCKKQKGTVLYMGRSETARNPWRRVTALAACLVVVVAAVAGGLFYRANRAVAATVSLDVNPSIEILVNQRERVLDVRAGNEDGRAIIGDMDFTGSDLELTVNALIGSMLRNGYLSELSNSILISVEGRDAASGAALQQRLASEVDALLQTASFTGAVLSQTVTADAQLQQQAEAYGITQGKAQLISQLVAQNPLYTFEELSALSINELNLLLDDGAASTQSVTSVGTASDKAYIGAEQAEQAAMDHAGVTATDWIRTELDFEDGRMVYEVKFVSGGFEYEYDIDAMTGSVVKYEREGNQWQVTPPPTEQPTAQAITEQQAREIALTHAGVSDPARFRIELDWDDGVQRYEIEFRSGGYEYEYEINASTGAILKFDCERDD